MKIPILFVIITIVLFYIILPLLIWVCARRTKLGKVIVILCSVLFGIVLFFGITSKVTIADSYVIVDVDYTCKWFNTEINLNLFDMDKIDFFINITMLIPIGLVVVYFSKRKPFSKLLILTIVGLVMGLTLECLQFVLPVYRSVQLSDVILNTISVFLGGCLGIAYDFILNKVRKK